jgi:hypothetical protein
MRRASRGEVERGLEAVGAGAPAHDVVPKAWMPFRISTLNDVQTACVFA